MIKRISLLLLITLIIIGVCGCMDLSSKNNANRKESDKEYTEMMKTFLEEKYSQSFEVIGTVFPENSFDAELEQNIVTLRDNKGVLCNVMASLSTPYDYYDDYIESYTAYLLELKLDNQLFKSGIARAYVSVKDDSINKKDTDVDNIKSITVVGSINHSPEETDIQMIYELYNKIEEYGCGKVFFIIGFVKESKEFDSAVRNYYINGKANWSDYKGTFYAYLTVKESGLSYDEFETCIVKQ